MRYEFDHTVLGKLAGPVFDRIANTLVDAYVARADQLHAGAAIDATPPAPADGAALPSPPRSTGESSDD
jgi:hypothetical protein